jgi:hypothetical protein
MLDPIDVVELPALSSPNAESSSLPPSASASNTLLAGISAILQGFFPKLQTDEVFEKRNYTAISSRAIAKGVTRREDFHTRGFEAGVVLGFLALDKEDGHGLA